ncbi:MAG: GNAT family N-acetyltransferase [Bacteroidales bacterium]|nr:GNAT family N-acetyltransferase [Bacteroidales bacterium]
MLSGKLCFLRAVEPSDVEILYQIENDVTLWNDGSLSQPVTRFSIEGLVAQADADVYQTHQFRLMICDRLTNEEVGCVDFFDFDPHNMNGSIGIMVRKDYRGRGYGCDALMTFVDYLFSHLHVHSLAATMRASNDVSQQLFLKCGFERVGVRREWVRTSCGYEDEVLMQRISSI